MRRVNRARSAWPLPPSSHARAAGWARRLTIPAVFVVAGACASPGLPPGGPEDPDPPQLVAVTPDTMATGTAPRAVVFRFDEVVSERPRGASTLAGLFLISPRDGAPVVDWNRTAITVRPRRGWRRNTTYTVTMLPGLLDLRGNAREEGARTVFSTGSAIPSTAITGRVFDWVAGAPAARALVEAISRPDSVVYITQADSLGEFRLPHAPPGTYTVRAFVDANSNRGFDEREMWDSTQVALTDSATVELLAFVHDTIGPRITTITVMDSVTLRLGFDRPLDPGRAIGASLFTLRAQDSSIVPLRAANAAREWERARAARSDSVAADSARRAPPQAPAPGRAPPAVPIPAQPAGPDTLPARPQPSRPSPVSEVIVELERPLEPGGVYRLEARVRGLLLTRRTSSRAFTVPERTAGPDSTDAPTSGAGRTPRQ